MRRALAVAMMACLAAARAEACDVGPFAIEFRNASAELSDEAKELLDYEAEMLRSLGKDRVKVAFYGRKPGPGSSEQMLRTRRAAAIRQYLGGRGVGPSRIAIVAAPMAPPVMVVHGRTFRAPVTVELVGSPCGS